MKNISVDIYLIMGLTYKVVLSVHLCVCVRVCACVQNKKYIYKKKNIYIGFHIHLYLIWPGLRLRYPSVLVVWASGKHADLTQQLLWAAVMLQGFYPVGYLDISSLLLL